MAKELFEWVVTVGDDVFYLSEKQKLFLEENQDKRFVAFDKFTINPAFVSTMTRRKAQKLLEMYPCSQCHGSRQLYLGERDKEGKFPDCPTCEGTGVSF